MWVRCHVLALCEVGDYKMYIGSYYRLQHVDGEWEGGRYIIESILFRSVVPLLFYLIVEI